MGHHFSRRIFQTFDFVETMVVEFGVQGGENSRYLTVILYPSQLGIEIPFLLCRPVAHAKKGGGGGRPGRGGHRSGRFRVAAQIHRSRQRRRMDGRIRLDRRRRH